MTKKKCPKSDGGSTGWFAYAPNTGAAFTGHDDPSPVPYPYLKLMPDYGVDVPLWGFDWEALGLSEGLVADLAAWQEAFDDTYDPFGADRSRWVAIKARWERDARSLEARLRREIPAELELVVDLWPLEPD